MRSASPRTTKRPWARRSATISTRRSAIPRRYAGRARRSIRPIRRCRKAPRRCRTFVQAPPELARRLAQIGVVERADGPRAGEAAQSRPAAGFARGRSVALGRLCRRRARADRRGAPARRARPLAGDPGRTCRPRTHEVDAKRHAVAEAEAALAAAAAAETQARAAWREAQHATDAAREEHAAAEREISRNAARISALKEAQARISAGRSETMLARDGGGESARRAAPVCRPRSEARTPSTK